MALSNRKQSLLKLSIVLLALWPAFSLLYRWQYSGLGANSLAVLISETGKTALWLFVLTLSITPARRLLSALMILLRRPYGKRLADWNWLIRLRRSLGVLSFLYASLHFVFYFALDLGMDLVELRYEWSQKPYIAVGLLALLLMLPLFLTSTDWAMRQLKRNWRRIHRLMYPIAILLAVHYLWLVKPGLKDAWPWAGIIALLLLYRVLVFTGLIFRRNDNGMEVTR